MDSQLEVTLCYRYLNTIIIQDQSNLKYFLILLIFLTITIDLIYKNFLFFLLLSNFLRDAFALPFISNLSFRFNCEM